MSLMLMKNITDELGAVKPNVYPSKYTGDTIYLGNTADCFILAIEAGIYNWCKAKCDEWKSIPCASVGVVTIVPPLAYTALLKTKITIAPLSLQEVPVTSPLTIPGPLRLSTFIHQAFMPEYMGNPLDFTPLPHSKEEFAAALFNAVCMWMNSLWIISIDDPTNVGLTGAAGLGVILFPGVKVMGDLFAKVIGIWKPPNDFVFFAIFAFFLMLGTQGNICLPIPTIGTAPAGPYVGLTVPLPFPIFDVPSLPGMPGIGGISMPKFTLPPMPDFTIPEFPGFEGFGLPDFSFAVPEINLDFVLPILGLPDWQALVRYLIKLLKKLPFSLGEFKFWSLGEFEFKLQFPDFGPFTLPDILTGFKLTLPEFCILTNLFSLPDFKLPPMTFLWWLPTILFCSNGDGPNNPEGISTAMSILTSAAGDLNMSELFNEAMTAGTMSGLSLADIMTTQASNSAFYRDDYNIFTSATFVTQINNIRDDASVVGEDYANVMSYAFDIDSICLAKFTIPRVVVKTNVVNNIPFVREY